MIFKKLLHFSVIIIVIFGCSTRDLVYFSDLESGTSIQSQISEAVSPRIQKDDLLSITVNSLSPESNLLFNLGLLTTGAGDGGVVRNEVGSRLATEGYLVDTNGEINFPVLGKIKVEGLTKMECIDKLSELVGEYVKDPIINIRFINFKITVIGEVNKPASFVIPTEKISVLEAIGMAGDMTMFGKRENVLILRETGNERKAVRINLNSKEFLNSPYFYMQQNDIIYVEPDRIKSVQASTNQRSLTVLGIITSLSIALIFNLRLMIERR
ncbi:polysaccharide biosynthesis/export family protein [Lunatibacter salilacus]|uniref:polysaccharide biosynthesis/export family protein n=1 Tax=Lunatibacter salilacus TaxID=2483804 RepID=UPI00131EB175|nr:polysaccharide biosynthesis/export family protein [Lunatibacter salilacus]